MRRAFLFGAAFALAALCPASAPSAQKPQKDLHSAGRTVWNLEGGAFFATDGRIPNGPCFRMTGQAYAPNFFDGLKRIDDNDGTRYVRGSEGVTEYPPKLDISILIHDLPCSFILKEKVTEPPLTKEDIGKLRVRLFWKHGVELRSTAKFLDPVLHIRELEPNIKPEADDLAKRYEWNLTFGLPCEGVPIEDSLVLTLQTPEGAIAARTSARL